MQITQKIRNTILTHYHTIPSTMNYIKQKLNINLNRCKNRNAIQILMPYAFAGGWVFDDKSTGLVREAFVCGMDDILTEMTERAGIKDAGTGFRLTFSPTPFPNYTHSFEWLRPEMGGNMYHCPENGITGWLCPALLKYFKAAPEALYARADAA
jgi:hypothetical protein